MLHAFIFLKLHKILVFFLILQKVFLIWIYYNEQKLKLIYEFIFIFYSNQEFFIFQIIFYNSKFIIITLINP